MKTHAIEDFAEIARNRKRINDEQTWRRKTPAMATPRRQRSRSRKGRLRQRPGALLAEHPRMTLTGTATGIVSDEP